MRIPVTLTAIALALGIVAVANSQVYKPGGGGGGVASGATVSGCFLNGANGGVLRNATGNVVVCDGTFTADAGGGVRAAGQAGGSYGTYQVWDVNATGSRSVLLGGATTGLRQSSSYQVGWSSNAASGSNDAFQNLDTTLCRQAAGVVEVGTTACNGSGNLMASAIIPGTIYSAAGTAVPACAAGTNGWTIVASDITTATYRTLYASGGANTGRLFCVNGTGWLSD